MKLFSHSPYWIVELLNWHYFLFPINFRRDSSIVMPLYNGLYQWSHFSALITRSRLAVRALIDFFPYLFVFSLTTLTTWTSEGSLGRTFTINDMSWKKLTIWPLEPNIPFLICITGTYGDTLWINNFSAIVRFCNSLGTLYMFLLSSFQIEEEHCSDDWITNFPLMNYNDYMYHSMFACLVFFHNTHDKSQSE